MPKLVPITEGPRLVPIGEPVLPEITDTIIPSEYEDMGDRIRNAYYYSKTLGVDPDLTFDHEKELNELVYGKGTSSSTAWNTTKKQYEKTNLWINTKRAWTQASKSWGAEHAGFLAMSGQISDEEALKISAQFKKFARENPIKARNWYEKQYLKLIGMGPAILGGKAEGAKFGLTGAAAGAAATAAIGQVPPFTLTPEEAVTVPGGAIGGIKVGSMIGEMKFWSEQGAGAIYLQAREQEVSKKTARIAASIGGPVYGAIEFSQIDRLSPTLAKFKKNILTAALEIAKDIAVEVGEEGIQRATTDGAVLLSKIFEGQVKALDVPAETLTIALNSWEEMKESIVPMAILMGPKSGITTLNILMEGSERGIENPQIANLEQKVTEIVTPEEAAEPPIKVSTKPVEPTVTPVEEKIPEWIDTIHPGYKFVHEKYPSLSQSMLNVPSEKAEFMTSAVSSAIRWVEKIGATATDVRLVGSAAKGRKVIGDIDVEVTVTPEQYNDIMKKQEIGPDIGGRPIDIFITDDVRTAVTKQISPQEVRITQIKAKPTPQAKPAEIAPEPPITPVELKVKKPPTEIEAPEEAKKAERELEVEAAEEVEAELYIGSITPGMKRRIEEKTQFKAEDIKGFHKPTGGPFTTIREKFKMARGEAEQYLEFLQNDLIRRLDENLINTENDLARANADWGDIRNLREALGMEKVTRPFTVDRAEKHKIKVIEKAKARIKEAIRPTIESKMTVGEVLSAVMKRTARAAKMGFVTGRRELRTQIRAKARAKKRINKALKVIQQKIPQTVDFFYREAIEALRGDIDLKGRGKRTEATIKSRREFLERATEEEKKLIPVKQIKQIGQKALNEMTIGELEEVAASIDELIKQGKLKRKLTLKPELEQRQKDIEELTEATEKVKPSRKKPGPQVKSITEKNLKDKVFDIVKPLTWRPSRLFDWLDGGKNFKGAWHRIFYDNVKGARANQIRTSNARKESFGNKIKELNTSMWQLSKMREIDNVRYSAQEIIGIYMASKNELSRMALNFGHEMTDKDIDNVVNSMTANEKAIGDYLLNDYETNYPKLRRSVIEQENRDSGIQENYSPIRRKNVNYTTLSAEFIDDIIQRNTIRKHTPAKGMTIQRKDVPPSLQTEIRLDAINVWNEQVEKEARYIYMGPVVRHMNKVMANRNLRKVVAERFGNEVIEYIAGEHGYISRVANPYIYKQFGDIERISGKLRRNTAIAYLAYNLVTMGKQLPSALLYLADAGPSHLLASAIEFATNPMEIIERTRSLDPELKNRSIERELEELRSLHNGNLIKQKVTEFGMEGIYLFDTIARTIGWNAVYQRAITEDKSEGEAIRLARNATLRTQPAAAAEDLPALYTTSEFLNWFTMFTNQLNQIYNIATYDIPSYIKNEQYGNAALQMFGMSMVALTIWMITNRRLPEEPEDFAEAIGEQAINMIPLLGKPIMSARKGWGGDLPAFKAARAIGVALTSLEDLELTRSDTKAIAEGIAVTFGIPYTAIRRAIKAIEEEKPTALLGAR